MSASIDPWDFQRRGAEKTETFFYVVTRVNDGYVPLAVVSRMPPAQNRWMMTSKRFLIARARRIRQVLSDPRHACALHAEKTAAMHIYRDGIGVLGGRCWAPGVTVDKDAFLRDPLPSMFPFTAHAFLCSITQGSAITYWSHLPLQTTFEPENVRFNALIFDVSDLNNVGCCVVSTQIHDSTPVQYFLSVLEYSRVFDLADELVEGKESADEYSFVPFIDSQNLTSLLWATDNTDEAGNSSVLRGLSGVKSLKELALGALVKSTEHIKELEPTLLNSSRQIPGFAADLEHVLIDRATRNCHAGALSELLAVISGGRRLCLVLVDMSCDALAGLLARDGVRDVVETLSFAVGTLEKGDMDGLLQAIRDMPELQTVYVADAKGLPTELGRRETAALQVEFVQRAIALGQDALRKRIFCSASYASALAGRPILGSNVQDKI